MRAVCATRSGGASARELPRCTSRGATSTSTPTSTSAAARRRRWAGVNAASRSTEAASRANIHETVHVLWETCASQRQPPRSSPAPGTPRRRCTAPAPPTRSSPRTARSTSSAAATGSSTSSEFDGRTWTVATQLPHGALNAPAAATLDGRIYVIGRVRGADEPADQCRRDLRPDREHVERRAAAARTARGPRSGRPRREDPPPGRRQLTVDARRPHRLRSRDADVERSRAAAAQRRQRRSRRLPRHAVRDRRAKRPIRLRRRLSVRRIARPVDARAFDPAARDGRRRRLQGPHLLHRRRVAGVRTHARGRLPARARLDQVVKAKKLPTPRNYARAVVFQSSIYVVGGSRAAGESHSAAGSRVVERYR